MQSSLQVNRSKDQLDDEAKWYQKMGDIMADFFSNKKSIDKIV